MKVRCHGCKEYIEKVEAIKSGLSYYCDNSCLYSRSNSKRQNSARATTAKRRQAKPGLSRAATEAILSRDGYSCRYCGSSTNLAVHHIYYRSDFTNKKYENESWNLITLCNYPCHIDIVHGNKKRFQRLCLGVNWLRIVENISITIPKLEMRISEFI